MSSANNELPSQSPASIAIADIRSGVVVFLVALPLCLGIAVASDAPPLSGLLAGIIGGIVVGALSGSHTSVSGPAAGLTAIVSMYIATLGSFEAFLLAVLIGGVFQIAMGLAKAGLLSAFFPTSVIKGLLAAIGVILILKQFPHLLGHDNDPEGDMAFQQPDEKNTFSEIFSALSGDVHISAAVIGFLSLALLILWGRWKPLKNSIVPGPLVVVLLGVGIHLLFRKWGGSWVIESSHLVQIPVAKTAQELKGFLRIADFSQWLNPQVYVAGATLAIVGSLETLLNLQAVDKLDTQKRTSPPSRELWAQGVGNVLAGFVGALPMTSVIVRSSVNVNAGGRTKSAAVLHGVLLLASVVLLPTYLNMIPLSALAAILIVTGFKLASPMLVRQMWVDGRYQFIPFIITVLAIVFTNLLYGILIGLAVSVVFILNSNLRRPVRRMVTTQMGDEIIHVELANQVSFLNRAALTKLFDEAPRGSHVMIDASQSDYIDPDIRSLIREYREVTAPARGVRTSLTGFREKYQLPDDTPMYCSTQELQVKATPDQVLEILREGNRRFRMGDRIARDYGQQVGMTAAGQSPLATVLSCIDSRVPAELVFDLGIGDIFSVRVAGNVLGDEALGSIEYGVGVAGVKLVLVMGHTNCGAVNASIDMFRNQQSASEASGCQHLQPIVDQISKSIDRDTCESVDSDSPESVTTFADEVTRRNVLRTVMEIKKQSSVVEEAIQAGKIHLVGAVYDVRTGEIEFLTSEEDSEVVA